MNHPEGRSFNQKHSKAIMKEYGRYQRLLNLTDSVLDWREQFVLTFEMVCVVLWCSKIDVDLQFIAPKSLQHIYCLEYLGNGDIP